MIEQQRISVLQEKEENIDNSYILYWMQGAQRTRYNHALQYAAQKAHYYNIPLVVYFGVTDTYPEASIRHYHFMMQGIKEVYQSLAHHNIKMVIAHTDVALGAIKHRNRNAPVPLTTHAPVRTVFNHSIKSFGAPTRNKVDAIKFFKSFLANIIIFIVH